MLSFLQVRCEAHYLARAIRTSLRDNPQGWHLGGGGTEIETTPDHKLKLRIDPCCCLRLCDKVRVTFAGADVWLPLLVRLRLRTAMRLFAAERANEWWDERGN